MNPCIVRAFSVAAGLLLLTNAGWGSTFLVIDVGPYEFTVPADSLTVPPAAVLNIGTSTGQQAPFKYIGVRSNNPMPNFIVVGPSSGTAPGANVGIGLNPNVVAYLPPGPYGLQVLFGTPGDPASVAGAVVQLTVMPPPPPVVTFVFNAASLQPLVSVGAMLSIFGANLGTPPISAQYNDSGLYPTTLGNTTVTFNGTPAPLLYVSTTQINAVVPYEVAGQKNVNVIVTHDSQPSSAFSVPLVDTSPAIFTTTQTGKGQAAILNADGTPNSADNPAAKGSTIAIFATGGGVLNQTVQDGSILLVVLEPPGYKPSAPLSLTIGGQPAKIIYSGVAPFEVNGMLQINATIPQNIGSGPQPVVLKIGDNDNAAQQVAVAIK